MRKLSHKVAIKVQAASRYSVFQLSRAMMLFRCMIMLYFATLLSTYGTVPSTVLYLYIAFCMYLIIMMSIFDNEVISDYFIINM